MTDRIARLTALRTVAVLVLAAFAIRAWQFGNPLMLTDEQFYLLVGQRIWDGQVPYVDIWDRKPTGLFALYALFARIGEGVWAYQVAATLFAAATAVVVHALARRHASDKAALLAALTYLASLQLLGGQGGQSPVFYNLFIAAAALLVQAAFDAATARALVRRGGLAMLLAGLALQVKYSAVFEGLGLGLLLILALRGRVSLVAGAAISAGWAGVALLPTALAVAGYALGGHLDDFVFANFTSFFARDDAANASVLADLAQMIALTLPLAAAAVAGIAVLLRQDRAGAAPVPLAWLGSAVFGVMVTGTFYDHYALVLLAPLAVCAAPVFDAAGRTRWTGLFAIAFGLIVGTFLSWTAQVRYGTSSQLAPFVRIIGTRPTGCLYVFEGPAALYSATHACLLSRYAYPSHLTRLNERHAIGVDPVAEVRRIMAAGPAFLVMYRDPRAEENPRAIAALRQGLAGRYRLVLRAPIGSKVQDLYVRQSTVPVPSNAALREHPPGQKL
ncbi:hypothetical protein [Novosphingobium colocasiae]|uniref:hypothetical protein n=1 Tax=Novosphingobium colocasiae TaxID=1256513 RepID=UPI0035B1F40F